MVSASPAAAADQPLLLNVTNTSTGHTRVQGFGFDVNLLGGTEDQPAINGDALVDGGVGILGRARRKAGGSEAAGVKGQLFPPGGSSAQLPGIVPVEAAVYGETSDAIGVYGAAGAGTGVRGRTDTGTGVVASAASGTGLRAFSTAGIGVQAQGVFPLRLVRAALAPNSPPSTSECLGGEVFVDTNGGLFICPLPLGPAFHRIGFNPVVPYRVLDTRPGGGTPPFSGTKLSAGDANALVLTVSPSGGTGGVTPPASAVLMNVTVLNGTAPSFLWPNGAARPLASNLNWVAGQPATPNLVACGVGASGAIKLFNSAGTVDVIVDIAGFFS